MFGQLHEIKTKLARMKILDVFRKESHSHMLITLGLNLLDLLEVTLDEEAMNTIAELFLQKKTSINAHHSIVGLTTVDQSAGLCG